MDSRTALRNKWHLTNKKRIETKPRVSNSILACEQACYNGQLLVVQVKKQCHIPPLKSNIFSVSLVPLLHTDPLVRQTKPAQPSRQVTHPLTPHTPSSRCFECVWLCEAWNLPWVEDWILRFISSFSFFKSVFSFSSSSTLYTQKRKKSHTTLSAQTIR